MNSQSVSVIIPVHNGAKYLDTALQSVFAQTQQPSEVIVVDDGSTDDSVKVAQAYAPRVSVFTQANLGPSSARNRGVAQASGTLLAFLDSDDLWTPDKLRIQTQELQANPACEAVTGRVENFISPELDSFQRQVLANASTQTGNIHVGALLIRRTAFARIGEFDPNRRHGDFIEWWARGQQANLIYAITPALVLRRRLHQNNLTRRERDQRREYLSLLRQKVARQRDAQAESARLTSSPTP